MKTGLGDQLDRSVLDGDLSRLYKSGLVEKVDFFQEPYNDGVRLIIQVEARAKLREVLFIGNSAVTGKKLRNRIGLITGQTWDNSAIMEARQEILDLYANKGYEDVGVVHSVETAADGFSRITFSVDEGMRTVLGRIEFEGNEAFSAMELRSKMKLRERRMLKLFGKKSKVDNQVLEEDVLTIENLYRDAGYLYARVADIERRATGREDHFDLILKISEGTVQKISNVEVTGTSAVSGEMMTSKLQMKPGGKYSAKAVRQDIDFLREYYGRKGYLNLNVRPRLTDAGDNSISVEYSISEGAPFTIGEIEIVGNEDTQDRVIRRELAILPGETFNTALVDASVKRLDKLPNFSNVQIYPVDSDEESYKDIRIIVNETDTGEIKFGAGISSNSSVVGFINLKQRNFDLWDWPRFKGAGQTFDLNLQAGARRRDFELSFTEPWFMGKELTLHTGLFYHDILYNSDLYDERHSGGKVSLRKKVGEHSSVTGGYRLDFGKIHNIESSASDLIASEEGDFTDSMVFAEYNITTLDDFYFPRRGHRLNLRTEFSGVGGDVNTYAFEVGAAKYFHLPLDTVFHLEGLFRTIDSHGGGGVPIHKREYLGSATNLRGYDYREVGPKDETGEPLGGLSSLSVTAEVSTPLPGKLGYRVRVAAFGDAGTVSRNAWDLDDIYGDVGIGLRLFIIGDAPIRLDYAFPLKTDRYNDSGGKFNIQMGIKF